MVELIRTLHNQDVRRANGEILCCVEPFEQSFVPLRESEQGEFCRGDFHKWRRPLL